MRKLSDELDIVKNICTYWDDGKTSVIKQTLSSWKKHNKDYALSLIDRAEIQEFLQEYNYKYLYLYFNRFNLYSIRSDIARIAHLFIYGGFYLDSHVGLYGSLNNICYDNNLNDYNKDSLCYTQPMGLIYSQPKAKLLLECLDVMNIKVKEIILSNKIRAGQYKKDMYVACGNGMYNHLNKKGEIIDFNTQPSNTDQILKFFRIFVEDDSLYRFYGNSLVMDKQRETNHWSVVSEKIDLI